MDSKNANALFTSIMRPEVIHFQGVMSWALITFWLTQLWDELLATTKAGKVERLWIVLCLLFGLGFSITSLWDWGIEYILTAIGLGFSLGFALINPTIAVCLQTSLLFLRPWELIEKNDYFAMLPKFSFTLCVAHIFFQMAKKKKPRPQWSHETTILIFYALWLFITTFKAPNFVSAQVKYFDTFFKSLFLYLMILNVIENQKSLKVLLGTIVLTFFGVSAISIEQTHLLAKITNGAESRLKGIGAFSNSNDIAALLVLVMPFALMTFIREKGHPILRSFLVIVMMVILYSIHLSQSRGAMLALLLSFGLYVVLQVRKRWLTISFAACAVLAMVAYTQLSTRNSDDLSESSSSRMTYVKTGLVMGAKNPVLGVGFEGYEENFERYATEILYEWGHRTAHNSWILAFAETGFLGLSLFIYLFFLNARLAWRIFPEQPEFLLGLVGYGFCISFLSHTYLLYPYLLFGLIGVAFRLQNTTTATSI